MSEDTEKDSFPSQEEWEADRRNRAMQQGLDPDDPNATPEQRPQGTIAPEPVTGEIQKRLRENGSNLADNAPAHGYEEHKRANSDAQAKKAARQSFGPERLYPGAHCVIVNEDDDGSEHNGRPVAVNSVAEFESVEDERINAAGGPNARFAVVKSYECRSRDGRAELLIVSADHLKKVDVVDFHRGVT